MPALERHRDLIRQQCPCRLFAMTQGSAPSFRCVTRAARQRLASLLRLPNTPGMQDWEWEVADPERIEEFLSLYEVGGLGEDERFALMEVLIQSFEDSARELTGDPGWERLLALLGRNLDVHRYSVWHWSAVEAAATEDVWRVSPFLRPLLGR